MPSQRIKLRRGTTAQQQNFTGAEGEVTFDTDKNTLIVHDGTTKGGHVLPRATDIKTDINQLTDVYGILQAYLDGFSGATETYTITVAAASTGGGNVFYITGLENPHIVLTPGNRYIFDVSDSSNTGHPLYFTADDGTTNYTTGVSRIGTEGTAGAKVIFIIPADVPALKYYCSVHGLSMGNEISSVLNSGGGSTTEPNVLTTTVVQNNGSITTAAAYSGTNGYYANSTGDPNTRLMYTIPVADWNSWDVAEIEFYTKILSQDSFPSLVDLAGNINPDMRVYIRANRNGIYAAGAGATYNTDNTGWCTWSSWNKITLRIDMTQSSNNTTILVNDVVKHTGTTSQTWAGHGGTDNIYLSFFQMVDTANGDNGVEAYIDEIYIKGYTNGSVTQQFYQGF